MEAKTELTRWHELFGGLLEQVISPTGILVQTNVDVSSTPPEIDILLIQNVTTSRTWTTEQLAYLPDGIRESQARYILIEFKYTESISRRGAKALGGYEEFFLRSRSLAEKEVQSFFVSARQPQRRTRELLGYTQLLSPGVYNNTSFLLAHSRLIVLSELPATPHNAFFKLFAHQRKAKQAALVSFETHHQAKVTVEVEWMIRSLMDLWTITGETPMRAITKEDLLKRGQELPRLLLPLITEAEFAEVLGNTPYIQRIREEGLERGLEQGREEGREEGLVQGLHNAIELGLELKFGPTGLALLPEIKQITTVTSLKAIQQALKTALTLAEIRQCYRPQR